MVEESACTMKEEEMMGVDGYRRESYVGVVGWEKEGLGTT